MLTEPGEARPDSSSWLRVFIMPAWTRWPVTVLVMLVMWGAREAREGEERTAQVEVEVKLIRASTNTADFLENLGFSGLR